MAVRLVTVAPAVRVAPVGQRPALLRAPMVARAAPVAWVARPQATAVLVVLAVPVAQGSMAPVQRLEPVQMAVLARLAVMVARVVRAVMRCLPTEVAARVAWAVTPVMAVWAVMVVRVRMPVPGMRRRRAAAVALGLAVVPVARVA
jgi:hypothetical protein